MLFLASEESGIMLSLLRTILMTLCNVVYKLIIVMYDLFMAIGSATLLTSEQIQIIYNRVGLILGIVMIFRLMFSFIQYMIDPDKISDKESGVGSLIKKVIVVILALGLTDWVFNKAFEIQDIILQENTIGKVVLGVSSNDDVGMEEFGAQFSYELFSNFFYQNPEVNEDGEAKAANIGCGSDFFSTDLKRYVGTYKDFEAVHKCLNEDGDPDGKTFGNKVYYASFDGLEALLIGGVVLWVLLMYTITLAVRVVKLAFLRIIAPIPILSYIAPKKETAFQKWIKQCVTTYLDLFIRLAIIYFCMLLISIIFASDDVAINASTYLSPSSSLYKWFNIILILGILIFAKKIPEILGEIFPSLGGKGGLDFGFGLKSRTDFLGAKVAKKVPGAAIGGVSSAGISGIARFRTNMKQGKGVGRAILGGAGGLVLGAGRGIYQGYKGGTPIKGMQAAYGKTREADDKYDTMIAEGGTTFGVARSKVSNIFGETQGQMYQRKIANHQLIIDAEDSYKKEADKIGVLRKFRDKIEESKLNGTYTTSMEDDYKTIRKAVITASVQGKTNLTVEKMMQANPNWKFKSNLVNDQDLHKLLTNDSIVDPTETEDVTHATEIRLTAQSTKEKARAYGLKPYDVENMNADDINKRSADAMQEIQNIKASEEYSRAIAADKAAGVDSNKNTKNNK